MLHTRYGQILAPRTTRVRVYSCGGWQCGYTYIRALPLDTYSRAYGRRVVLRAPDGTEEEHALGDVAIDSPTCAE